MGIGCVMDVLILFKEHASKEKKKTHTHKNRPNARHETGDEIKLCTTESDWNRRSLHEWEIEFVWVRLSKGHNCYGRDAKTDCTRCDSRIFVLMEKCHTLHEVKLMAFSFIQTASHYILSANERANEMNEGTVVRKWVGRWREGGRASTSARAFMLPSARFSLCA